jgi:ankyrin repeat protein
MASNKSFPLIFAILFFLSVISPIFPSPKIQDDPQSIRVILFAVERNYKDIILQVLKNGVDINSKDINGNSAISIASENGYESMVKLLLSKGANSKDIKPAHHSPFVIPEIQEDYQAPEIFIYGVKWGIREIVESMLNKGVPIESMDSEGNTALGVAVANNHLSIIEYLIAKNARLDTINGIEESIIEHALNNDGILGAVFLSQKAQVKVRPESEWYIRQLFAFITKIDKNKDAKDSDTEKNLLMTAASKNHPKTIEYLVKNGFNINAEYKSNVLRNKPLNGSTALMFALRENTGTNAAYELIRLKASLDNINNSDETALLISVYYSDLEMAKTLLDAGANVNKADSFGHTPYYNAMMNSDQEMIKFLKSRNGK